jgi:hypothetical protein
MTSSPLSIAIPGTNIRKYELAVYQTVVKLLTQRPSFHCMWLTVSIRETDLWVSPAFQFLIGADKIRSYNPGHHYNTTIELHNGSSIYITCHKTTRGYKSHPELVVVEGVSLQPVIQNFILPISGLLDSPRAYWTTYDDPWIRSKVPKEIPNFYFGEKDTQNILRLLHPSVTFYILLNKLLYIESLQRMVQIFIGIPPLP